MGAWPPQASYPCGNFSDTSILKLSGKHKGSLGHTFVVCIRTENQNQAGFCPYTLPVVSVHGEPTLGHSRCILKNVPPQSNSPFDTVIGRNLQLTIARQPRLGRWTHSRKASQPRPYQMVAQLAQP
ncbi:Regulator of rDNA transcription protein 15 [Thelohanellus kitauei]|uniref:Regulator of rDNA transcription protein 15 n=1 Tax=Thelohanellus kitauei TaxID=669202 RepID=A0A0C2MPS2_THEKT|nr:Regulator of rDNA transcription protein 15 [Thelohanellus kitauei]